MIRYRPCELFQCIFTVRLPLSHIGSDIEVSSTVQPFAYPLVGLLAISRLIALTYTCAPLYRASSLTRCIFDLPKRLLSSFSSSGNPLNSAFMSSSPRLYL